MAHRAGEQPSQAGDADAHAVPVEACAPVDVTTWSEALFADPPGWVAALLALRAALVGVVGIERVGSDAFRVLAVDDGEALLGSDADHLDFRASVRREPDRVVVSTVVQLHNLRGRLYLAVVRVVHPVIVRAMLTRAAATLTQANRVPVGPS